MRFNVGALPILLLAFAVLISGGCRKEASGTIDPDLHSPFILNSGVALDHVDLDTSGLPIVTQNADRSYTLSDSVTATIVDPVDASRIRSCSYSLVRPGTSEVFQSGAVTLLDRSGNIAHAGLRFAFRLQRDEIGIYVIKITATGADGNISNTLLSSLLVTRRNSRPRIFGLLAPDTLTRPSTGAQIVRIALTAADSDGLADIDKVFFKSINSTSPDFEQPLFDDGLRSADGDSVANDGRYSRLIPLDSSATTGTKEFRFWARDKSGALSDSLIHFIVVRP